MPKMESVSLSNASKTLVLEGKNRLCCPELDVGALVWGSTSVDRFIIDENNKFQHIFPQREHAFVLIFLIVRDHVKKWFYTLGVTLEITV